MDNKQTRRGVGLGEVVAQRLRVPFLVLDSVVTADGRWLVIECNNGQKGGYAGIWPLACWLAMVQDCDGATTG